MTALPASLLASAAPESAHERVDLRVHGETGLPVLVYLPGIHGDWTLVGSFRRALAGRVRFVEMRYPRTVAWSLDHHAAEIDSALEQAGVREGWILAESFGSQIGWRLASRHRRFQARGLILAGGFGRYPMLRMARGVRPLMKRVPMPVVSFLLRGYRAAGRWRFRSAPELRQDLDEFVARRTVADRDAAVHRLDLLMANEPASLAEALRIPVYYLTGLVDPVVPWPWVVPWLRRHCPAFRGWRLIWGADHNVLGSGGAASAEQVLAWMAVEGNFG